MDQVPIHTGTATLSVTVITLNEEQNLPRCLESVADLADQIVVVDSGSSDVTQEIAVAAGAVVHTRPFSGYGVQKQFALEQANCDWVLCLDAGGFLGIYALFFAARAGGRHSGGSCSGSFSDSVTASTIWRASAVCAGPHWARMTS